MISIPVFLVVQVDRDGAVLGVRSVYFSEGEANDDCARANAEHADAITQTGWPIWKVREADARCDG